MLQWAKKTPGLSTTARQPHLQPGESGFPEAEDLEALFTVMAIVPGSLTGTPTPPAPVSLCGLSPHPSPFCLSETFMSPD